jgi:hypothetical protein
MNKLIKILLSILAGINIIIEILTPILLAAIWINISSLDSWKEILIYSIGGLSSFFRSIKVGWFKW